ncbi:50S ribosomal protein L5 [Candidatus Micrarchaeota archaeon CG_4_10_14_0_2_um_filter_60_11]|nr:MAG: 50S ribosomal protein L5 [Candidatus Micrarchaeota archaeon CG1_02_60_51]PIN96504.1 MAG: 50S ribosomal protein L5 [Candidatus Micrarchaeota archaeon CG10_big_fil_rev_8_21_14_0_10_60_32]PIO01876.1 MAG: 50S ribosomal protein L5 [Candidatus Micrarchaeota archaeon CG09_land_8_20_14_0_10_60_16]PIY91555.1 MAG: 50S ribosomal protein L5 [Candidatus Micrarchaeota archaeon CG_4_10_14_0_8_um_filter_60_7]PIZ90843.1 MAG: 50S ribosomal protein L5 [Candidatus Micrarchaeota archaeon CG_4_10_14_0_2_um_f
MNPMQQPRLEKVTVNIGVGASGQPLDNARTLLERLTGGKPMTTRAKRREPSFHLRQGDEIGVKITLRGKTAKEFVKKAFDARDNEISTRSFDEYGNVSFGVKEYIDFPGAKYDPKLGMIGFDVCLSLRKPGANISKRRIAPHRVPKRHRVSSRESREFIAKEYGVTIKE